MATPKLEHILNYTAELAPPMAVGAGPRGHRHIFNVIGGSFEGVGPAAGLKGNVSTTISSLYHLLSLVGLALDSSSQ